MKNNKSLSHNLRLYHPPPEDVSTFKTSHFTVKRKPLNETHGGVTGMSHRNNTAIANLAGILKSTQRPSELQDAMIYSDNTAILNLADIVVICVLYDIVW